jgi:hypothetical protein
MLAYHQKVRGIKAGSKLKVLSDVNDDLIAQYDKGKEYEIDLTKADKFNVFETKIITV